MENEQGAGGGGETFGGREAGLYGYDNWGDSGHFRWDPDDYDGPSPGHNDTQGDFSIRVGSPFYQPAGSVSTEPDDLEHFSKMIFSDRDAFQDAKTQAVNEFFDSMIPPFQGDTEANGGLPEGMNFAKEYFDREMAMKMFLLDVESGLAALGMAAMFIHFDYVMADFLSGGDGSAGFANYTDASVTATFDNPQAQAPAGDSEADDEIAGEWQDELDRQEQIAEEQGGIAGSEFDEDNVDTGDRGYTGDTLHEGQDGEYEVENTDDVAQADGAGRLTVDRDDGEVRPPAVAYPGQSSDWSHPIPEDER